MHILLFGPYPFPGHPPEGGVMAVVHALAQGLSRRPGLKVSVAAAHVAASEGVEQDGQVTVYRLPVPRLPRATWHRRLRRSLVQTARAIQPDLVHGHGTGFYAAAALDSGLPAVITVHGVVRMEAALSGATRLKERLAWRYDALFEAWVLRRARRCIAISPYVRRAFARHQHIHWHDIPNPVPDACFDLERRPEAGRLLCPARIIPRKGIDLLIRAFAQVAGDFPAAELRLAGELDSLPAYAAHCRQLAAAAAGLEQRVHFLGNLPPAALRAEYAQAQAVVLAARQETAPVAVAEALAAGCPVVAAAVGGLPDMVDPERTGLLTPPGDQAALAAALARILADPLQTAAWGQAARRAAARYRLDRVVEATVGVYGSVR